MSFFESDFSYDNPDMSNEFTREIEKCKRLIDEGSIYSCIEIVEEVIQTCVDNAFYEDGIYLVNKLLEVSPYNSEYWVKKGALLNGLFKFDKAIECYNKALSLNPGDSDALIEKAAAEENLGLMDEAKESLETALEREPDNEESLFNLGLIYKFN